MSEPSPIPLRIHYDLTEADVRRYVASGRFGKACRSFRCRPLGWLAMLALGAFLVGICYQGHGLRAGSLVLGATLAVLTALACAREVRFERRVARLAGLMGLPRTLDLVLSPRGIAEGSDSGVPDPGRTFAWHEVEEIARVDHLTVIRLRPAGGVLIIPDRAFESGSEQIAFEGTLKAWQAAGGVAIPS